MVLLHLHDRLSGVDDPVIEDRVHLERDVVPCDDVLGRHVVDDGAQRDSHHPIDEGEHQRDARPLRRLDEPSEPEDHRSLIFAEDLDRAQDVEDHHRDDNQKRKGTASRTAHSVLLFYGVPVLVPELFDLEHHSLD